VLNLGPLGHSPLPQPGGQARRVLRRGLHRRVCEECLRLSPVAHRLVRTMLTSDFTPRGLAQLASRLEEEHMGDRKRGLLGACPMVIDPTGEVGLNGRMAEYP
jgi:hypothetical protein